MSWLRQSAQDVRYALRLLRRVPGFTATVLIVLALGIGMTSAVFSVVNAVLLRPVAYPNSERLVWLSMHETSGPHPTAAVLGPDYFSWKEQAVSFEHLVAYDLSDDPMILDGAATRERVAMVSHGFWELSGVRFSYGRPPGAGERDTVVVSYDFFEGRLAGDAERLGKTVTIDGRICAIVGVLPRGFPLHVPWPGWPGFEPREISVYRTANIEPAAGNMVQLLNVVGKLKPGVTIEQATAELETVRARLAQARPEYRGNDMALRLVPLSDELSRDARLPLAVLLTAVGLVLVIACANVASLVYARGSARRKEIAIRAAAGASRARLLRQLLIESVILGLAGGAAGILVAGWAVSLIVTLVPQAIPRLVESSIDGAVLLFTFAASLITAVAFGVGPALALGAVNPHDTLKLGASPSASGSLTSRTARVFVAAEMALAVVLLTGAGLVVKSFWRLNAHPSGFEPQRVLTMNVQFSGPQYDEDSRRRAYVDEFLRRVEAVPGVSAAGISSHGDIRSVATVEGAPSLPPEEVMQRSSVLVNVVSAGSARALGMHVLQGRWLSAVELPDKVVVNESLARRDFPGQEAVGRRISLDDAQAPPVTIVGVVADLQYAKLDERPEPEVFVPYSRGAPWRFTAVARTPLDAATLAAPVRSAVSTIDPALPVFDVRTLEDALAESIAPRRFNVFLLTVFAVVAVALAVIGVYGMAAYSVAQRTHEIGIRMAVGADRRDILAMVVWQALGAALTGIAVGIAATALLTRQMESLLFGVPALDPQTFAAAAVGLTLTALMASVLPALRAARIDPAETLR